MTSDTYLSRNLGQCYAGGSSRRQKAMKTGEAGIYPSYIITKRNTNTTMYLFKIDDYAVTGYMPSGIADLMDGHEIDTVYASGALVEWFMIGQDTDVYVHVINANPAPSYEIGDDIVASTTDGYGQKYGGFSTAKDYTASPLLKIGKAAEYRAGSTSDTKLLKVNLAG